MAEDKMVEVLVSVHIELFLVETGSRRGKRFISGCRTGKKKMVKDPYQVADLNRAVKETLQEIRPDSGYWD